MSETPEDSDQAAAAENPPPPNPGVQFNPQSGYPVGAGETPQNPYGQPPPAPPYAQPQYGQPAYPQPQYGQHQPFQPYALPNHPKAVTALVLGLISTVGGLMCVVPVLVSPFAWFVGARTRREIRNAPGQYDGDGMATAGMVLGIIGTVLLGIGLIIVAIIVIIAISNPDAFDNSSV